MKVRKGICLILCILLLSALAPRGVFAVSGECVDGVWASIALTGGANKVIFSADSEVERQILNADDQSAPQYIPPEGMAYDAASNTLYLTDFDGDTANLVLTMMGGDFKISLSGSSKLGSILSESKGRGGSITFCGDGSLEIVSSEAAILVRAGGAPDFVRIEPQVRLTAESAYGSAIRVENTSLASGAIVFDTCDPEMWAIDASTPLAPQLTTEDVQIDVCTLPGDDNLYGLEAVPLLDDAGERIVYNVYLLGGKDDAGRYSASLLLEKLEDISAYQAAATPHDWTLADAGGGTVFRARFSRFKVSASCTDGGAIGVSQNAVGRGGSVTVSVAPEDGYKLVSLLVNGEAVSPVNGSYTIAGITSDKTVTASFAEASAVSISVNAPESTDFKVPADGEEAIVSEPFTAAVKDGAGDPVGATVRWSIAPQTDGVSIGADGRVSVASAAKAAVGEGLSFTVTAAVDGTELVDASGRFTVALAERRASTIRLTRGGSALGETDTVPIPAAGETTRQQYGAVVYDQYGGVLTDTILWSAGDWPNGVRRDYDTLSVTDACRDGSMLIVTAKAASDESVSASVTVSFVKPDEAKKAAPMRAVPVIEWPTAALAENPEYGITWSELVTLSGGSATLGGETLEGTFALDKNGADWPELSDSYHVIFSYLDGEEVKTVEGAEETVTIAKKPLDASMITLSPAEAVYTGGEIKPAVSVMNRTRALVSGTDFELSAYANNVEIGTGSVTVAGIGHYSGAVTKNFTITPIPGSAVTVSVTPCKPEDEGTTPTVVLQYNESALAESTDYTVSLQYDIPAKTGTATITFKGHYSGTRVLSFDLPNYLITDGANASWSKSTSVTLDFKANGALGKFTELTVDGKTVPASYYTKESGSTIIRIKADYLKGLSAGKHIVGIAYKDGKALAIFSIIEIPRRGVPTGDSNNVAVWIALLAASLIAVCALGFAFVRSGQKKKKKKHRK